MTSELTITRVRHTLRMRLLQVVRVDSLTSHLLRVVLAGDALDGFVSAGFDDHCKVFFPSPGVDRPVLPEPGPNGPIFPKGSARPVMRDFTPRHFDPARRELTIDFVLHDAGPATTWARQARPGQYLGIGGPRGSFVVPDAFDWHLLIGDETALPAIARRLAELPAGKPAITVIAVRDDAARLRFDTRADLREVWCTNEPHALAQALGKIPLPTGDGFVWAAAESASVREVRDYLVGERGIRKDRIRASSYWRKGDAAVHESLDD
ncbi:MAG TPA: siderophore-interacting protein [Paraburkholderia sp.]|jgi:NADPH-dependent ferric siderophore reductase|nr:siderophore-interacting protein [Paraburkholderia sp.]